MKLFKISLTTLLVACMFIQPTPAVVKTQRQPPSFDTGKLFFFEQFVKNQMEKDKIPGLTIGFTKGKQTWVKGFGFADVERKVPAAADSAYPRESNAQEAVR